MTKFGASNKDAVEQDVFRTVQKQGRVDIPNRFFETVGLDIQDRCIIYCEEDVIMIMEKNLETFNEVKEKYNG